MIFYFQVRRSNGQRRGRFLGSLMQSSILILTHAAHTRMQNAQLTLLKRRTVFCKIGGGKRVFCNPPYGRELPKWIKKAHDEAEKGALVVMLIPARTDTRAFHDYIYHQAEIRFIRGRIKFGDAKTAAPFPSMIVIFKNNIVKPGGDKL